MRRERPVQPPSLLPIALVSALGLPIFILALYPPSAFDETLYHLPTVERFAESGSLPFIPNLRVPVFPHLHEVLAVPLFLAGGDVATHLLPLLASAITALFVLAWIMELESDVSGWLAVALFVSAPIVVHLASSGYVEALLTMFVAGSFYAFEQWLRSRSAGWLMMTALFAGSAAGVKYLGLFWLAVLGAGVAWRSAPEKRLAAMLLFCAVAGLLLLPWYGRILWFTGNPLFPYLPGLFGHSPWEPIVLAGADNLGERVVDAARIPWDTLFARDRVNAQPPFSIALVLVIPLVAWHAIRSYRARTLGALIIAWALVWTWLPSDSRYLTVVLPMASVAGASALSSLLARCKVKRRAAGVLALLLLLPGPLYAWHRIQRQGPLPHDAPTREVWLHRQIPAYPSVAFLNAVAGSEDVAYVCGAEELAYHFRGEMIGDSTGPARYSRMMEAPTAEELTRRLDSLGIRFVLVVESRCSLARLKDEAARAYFRQVYEDESTVVYERTARRNNALPR